MNCAYCSDEAIGLDEDDEPTCGDEETCAVVVTSITDAVKCACGWQGFDCAKCPRCGRGTYPENT